MFYHRCRPTKKLLSLSLVLLLSAGSMAEESVLEEAEASLASLKTYSTRFETKVQFRPEAPEMTLQGRMTGARPDRFLLEAGMKQGQTEQKTIMLFDSEWQWIEVLTSQGAELQERKIRRIEASIARPGHPFDTFYYFSGSGLLAGEDYLSHFERILTLYRFGEPRQEGEFRVLEGELIESRYREYLAERDQLAAVEALDIDEGMRRCRLYLSLNKSLPLGCDLGRNLETPVLRFRLLNFQENPKLAAETFQYRAPDGWAVSDITAATAKARMRAQSLKPGSDFFDLISAFLPEEESFDEELDEALRAGDAETVLKRVRAEPSLLNQPDLVGNTMLIRAAQDQYTELAKALLEMGSDPKFAGLSGVTALHCAVSNNDEELARALLQAGAPVNARKHNGQAPLHTAYREPMSEILLAAGAEEQVYDNYGELPPVVKERGHRFVMAAYEGDLDALKRGLDQGLEAHVPYKLDSYREFSALQMAAAGKLDTLKFLLSVWKEKGAARQPVLNGLLKFSSGPATLKYLVSQGASPSEVDLFTPLQGDTLVALLELGADPHKLDAEGRNLMVYHLTSEPGVDLESLLPFLQALAKEGVDPNQLFSDPQAAEEGLGKVALLHLATEEPQKVEALLELGARADLPTETGWTALHIAATYDARESMKILHERGASLTAPQDEGWTPLHSAVFLNQREAFAFLLAHQKELNLKDKAGNTALHLAAHLGRLDMIEKLLKAGAQKDIRNAEGESPADLAKKKRARNLLML